LRFLPASNTFNPYGGRGDMGKAVRGAISTTKKPQEPFIKGFKT